jgi:hypothetical protein
MPQRGQIFRSLPRDQSVPKVPDPDHNPIRLRIDPPGFDTTAPMSLQSHFPRPAKRRNICRRIGLSTRQPDQSIGTLLFREHREFLHRIVVRATRTQNQQIMRRFQERQFPEETRQFQDGAAQGAARGRIAYAASGAFLGLGDSLAGFRGDHGDKRRTSCCASSNGRISGPKTCPPIRAARPSTANGVG